MLYSLKLPSEMSKSIIILIKKKWLLWIYYLTLNTTSWDFFFHCDFSSWNIHICIWWLPKIKVSWIGNQVLHYLISRLNGYLELQLWSCCVTPSCHKKALFSRLISIYYIIICSFLKPQGSKIEELLTKTLINLMLCAIYIHV